MTEDEAKTKWCHAFTASHTDPRATDCEGGFQHHCIGSACMAWRFDEVGVHGFCGLAGPVV